MPAAISSAITQRNRKVKTAIGISSSGANVPQRFVAVLRELAHSFDIVRIAAEGRTFPATSSKPTTARGAHFRKPGYIMEAAARRLWHAACSRIACPFEGARARDTPRRAMKK